MPYKRVEPVLEKLMDITVYEGHAEERYKYWSEPRHGLHLKPGQDLIPHIPGHWTLRSATRIIERVRGKLF